MFKHKAEIATLATFLSLLSFVLFDVIGQNLTSPEQFSNLVEFQGQILSSLTAQAGGVNIWNLRRDCVMGNTRINVINNKIQISDPEGLWVVNVQWPIKGPDGRPVRGPGGRAIYYYRAPYPTTVEVPFPQNYYGYVSLGITYPCAPFTGGYSFFTTEVYVIRDSGIIERLSPGPRTQVGTWTPSQQ